MNVLGHHDISQDYKPIAAADSLKNCQEQIAVRSVIEEWKALVTTEREGV